MLNFLAGKKTYIVAGLMALLSFAKSMDWIDETTYLTLLGLLNAGGFASLKASNVKIEQKIKEVL